MKSLFGIDLFARPEALLLLLLIPAFVYWYNNYYKDRRLVIRLSYDPTRLHQPKWDLSALRFLPRVLQLFGIMLLILAMARPQSAKEIVERRADGIDIMLLMDVSSSMKTEDFIPNRLEVAKSTAIAFVQDRPFDRIGIVVFAGEAMNLTPLTVDHEYLIRMIRGIQPNAVPAPGTALGSAVAVGINRMRDSRQATRIMVLFTDGANNRGQIDPLNAARLASKHEIKLYCIGIGNDLSLSNSPQKVGFTGLDSRILEQMARISRGAFFHADDPQKLGEILGLISQMETSEIKQLTYRKIEDLYPIFLQPAIIFLGLAYLLMLTFMYNPLEH